MAYNESLADRVRTLFPSSEDIEEKKMFGGLAVMYQGYMCCGVTGDHLVIRVPRDEHADFLSRDHVSPMDFTGKSLKGFVYVNEDGYSRDDDLKRWLNIARDTVDTFPRKNV